MKPYAHVQSSGSEAFNQNRIELSDRTLKTKKLSVFKELPFEKGLISTHDSIKSDKIINIIFGEKENMKHYDIAFSKDSIKKTKLLKLKPTTSTERKAKTAGIFANSSIYLGIISTIGFIINSPAFFSIFFLSSLFLGILALFFGKPSLKKLDKLSPFRKYSQRGITIGILYLFTIICTTLVGLLMLAFINSFKIQ